VRGTFLFVQAAARAMRAHGGGAISITVSSAAALGEEFQVVYNASKAGVAAMTRSLAVDLAPYGIRVNGVSPGWVETRSTHPVIADPQLWAKYRSRIPLDRAAATEEIAAVHAFLLSEDASYVTGVVVAVDGGLTAGMRWTGWAAVVDPGDHDPTRIPELPPSLGRKTV
ncbi:MAG: SDR family oxidoreductase, partial [Thermoleophilia bacterium]|nr:SDR family oxidoreductase [Thermoleophilia bacterium]